MMDGIVLNEKIILDFKNKKIKNKLFYMYNNINEIYISSKERFKNTVNTSRQIF